MKNFKVIFAIVFSCVLMWSCMSQNSSASVDKSLQREWMMVSFKDYSKEKLMKYGGKINLVPNAENPNQFSAKMGCNNMFFTANMLNNDKIKFSQVGSTMMFCRDMMDLESDFGKLFPMMNQYKIDGHYLTLSDGKGNVMKFLAADWD